MQPYVETMRSESQAWDKTSFEWFTSVSHSRGRYVPVTRGKRRTKERLFAEEWSHFRSRPPRVASSYSRWMGLCAPASSLDVFMKKALVRMEGWGSLFMMCIYKCLSPNVHNRFPSLHFQQAAGFPQKTGQWVEVVFQRQSCDTVTVRDVACVWVNVSKLIISINEKHIFYR